MIHPNLRQFRIILGTLAVACSEPVDPPDKTAPEISVSVVADGDSDGDGLIDIHVSFARSAGVDLARTRVARLNGPRLDLTNVWRIQGTDTSLVIIETIPGLISEGPARLEVTIADSAGNAAVDTLSVELPPAKFVKTISTQRDGLMRAYDIAICDGVGYVPAGNYMAVFDPDSLTLLADVRNPDTLLELHHLACTPNGNIYVTEPLYAFDRAQRAWIGRIPNTFGADAIAASKLVANRVYIGEREGAIAVFEGSTGERIGRISGISSRDLDYVLAIAVLPQDEKLYFTRLLEGGIMVLDPRTPRTIGRIHIGGTDTYGASDDMVLSPDSRQLYATIYDGNPRGVVTIDTKTDVIQSVLPINDALPIGIDVSPSGKRLFVTTQDRFEGVQSDNLLIDIASSQIIQRFSRTRTDRRFDSRLVFHPNGKFIFVLRNMEIDVYLNRE